MRMTEADAAQMGDDDGALDRENAVEHADRARML
jgi:hypothetical protein